MKQLKVKKLQKSIEEIKDTHLQIMILGFLDKLQKGQAIIPAIPPLTRYRNFRGKSKDLEKIFGPDGAQWIKIGSLLRNPEIVTKD